MKYYKLTFYEYDGQEHISYVGKKTWKWINSRKPTFIDNAFNESLPPEVIAEGGHISAEDSGTGKENEVRVTSGSCQNDRAIATISWAPSKKPKDATQVLSGGTWHVY